MIREHDERQTRCPMLGHDVTFGYCRRVKQGVPCWKLLDCWFEQFPVEDFVRSHYSEKQVAQFLQCPKHKVLTLVDLIQQAQANSQREREAVDSEDRI